MNKNVELGVKQARLDHMYELRGEFSNWLITSDEEKRRVKSIIRVINNYIDVLWKEIDVLTNEIEEDE